MVVNCHSQSVLYIIIAHDLGRGNELSPAITIYLDALFAHEPDCDSQIISI